MAAPSWQFLKAETFSVGDTEPVATQAAIASPAADVAALKTAVDALITRLEAFGLVAPN